MGYTSSLAQKLAENFRQDSIRWILNNDSIMVLPLDSYPLIIEHYPELAGRLVGIPYGETSHNFDLLAEFRTMGSIGVLFEFLFPIARTIGKEILMLGFDGNDRSNDKPTDNKVPFPHYEHAEYPEEIVATIHASRLGYYDRDFTGFRDEYDVLFAEMINDAEEKGFTIRSLAPSHHTALKGKYYGS